MTGATGLIGKETVQPLLDSGFEIYAFTTGKKYNDARVNWLQADILDYTKIQMLLSQIKADYLLHFAWFTGEDYLSSPINYKLRDASLNLLTEFKEYGGKRAVFAGTCFEYQFKDTPLKETDTLNPTTIYAQCKNQLREQAQDYAEKNALSFGWGRIFYVYGHGENEKRLVPYIINSLKNNQKTIINSGPLLRDYMYSKDIAAAFAKFLDSNVTGCVNIAAGQGIYIKDIALEIAKQLDKTHLLEFIDNVGNQPLVIVGDVGRLNSEVDYKIQYKLEQALEKILEENVLI